MRKDLGVLAKALSTPTGKLAQKGFAFVEALTCNAERHFPHLPSALAASRFP
jgi:hypothetical protein